MQPMVDLRSFKEKLRSKLPTNRLVITALLSAPDNIPADRAAVLIPHYLRRLEREIEGYAPSGPLIIRS